MNNFLFSIFSEILSDFGSLSYILILVNLDLLMKLHIYLRVAFNFSEIFITETNLLFLMLSENLSEIC